MYLNWSLYPSERDALATDSNYQTLKGNLWTKHLYYFLEALLRNQIRRRVKVIQDWVAHSLKGRLNRLFQMIEIKCVFRYLLFLFFSHFLLTTFTFYLNFSKCSLSIFVASDSELMCKKPITYRFISVKNQYNQCTCSCVWKWETLRCTRKQ